MTDRTWIVSFIRRQPGRAFGSSFAHSIAFLAALLVASLASQLLSMILAAFAAGAAFACVSLMLGEECIEPDFRAREPLLRQLRRQVVAFCFVYALVFVAGSVWAAPRIFFCSAAVPWSPGIFAGGAYVLALLTSLNRKRKRSPQVHLIWIGLTWIAPWYGFFSIPAVAGAGLALDCVGRDVTDYLYIALIGVPAIMAGDRIGTWLSAGLPEEPINPYADL